MAQAQTRAPAAPGPAPERITFEGLDALARRSAARPYALPSEDGPDSLPDPLRALGYDGYRGIVFQPTRAPRLGDRFSLQLFHRGFLHRRRVAITLQPREGAPVPLTYAPDLFAFPPELAGSRFDSDLGFAGFRVHHAPAGSAPEAQEEFLVFLGAAYFRLRARGQEYGLSGRGVAVGTGLPTPEEFPDFTAFWIDEPEPGADALDILALLDGPSLAGAFRFRARPSVGAGAPASLEVAARLHPRGPIPRLGLAPLTSMFLHGAEGPAGGPRGFDDFRPEVHDSDGLLLALAEERAWRPLVNGRDGARVSAFATRRLDGFGLLQRERRFAAYLDVQARHEDRPGLWVAPRGDWGPGAVQLLEIPSREEYADNIVAAFVPDAPVAAGRPLALDYALTTVEASAPGGGTGGAPDPSPGPALARVVSTRIGSAERLRPTVPPSPARRLYVIDFEGGSLSADPTSPAGAELAAGITAEVAASAGTMVDPVVERVPQTGGWRLYVEHRPAADGGEAELSARLVARARGGAGTGEPRPLTELWRYAP